jgi:hypothetical protein
MQNGFNLFTAEHAEYAENHSLPHPFMRISSISRNTELQSSFSTSGSILLNLLSRT